MTAIRIISTPVGPLKLVAGPKGLKAVLWRSEIDGGSRDRHPVLDRTLDRILDDAESQLHEYFSGRRETFSIALDIEGTEFQTKVWRALLTIPYGETRTYREIAEQIGNPKATRAVGAANGKNPVSIVVPCHRVI